MKCPSCGYVSFERPSVCTNCGAPTSAAAVTPIPAVPQSGEIDAPVVKTRRSRRTRRLPPVESSAASDGGAIRGNSGEQFELSDEDLALQALPPPPFAASAGRQDPPADVLPIVDQMDEVPDRFWTPEGAGLLRRAAALLVDLALLAALFCLFLAGAALGLERAGVESSTLLSRPGLREALLPLALLAIVLSSVYHIPLAAVAGRTPGKRLAGLEVRCADGSAPTWGMAARRWCGGVLGLACGGVGIAWALFEPRRRGWADLFSNTVIAARAPEDAARTHGEPSWR